MSLRSVAATDQSKTALKGLSPTALLFETFTNAVTGETDLALVDSGGTLVVDEFSTDEMAAELTASATQAWGQKAVGAGIYGGL